MKKIAAKITNILSLLLLVSLLAGSVYIIAPKYNETRNLKRQRDELTRKIQYKQHEVETLKKRQRSFGCDADYVEFVARQHKRIKRNEVVFIYGPEDIR